MIKFYDIHPGEDVNMKKYISILALVTLVFSTSIYSSKSDNIEIEEIKKRAVAEYAEAQYSLGRAYDFGESVPQNYTKASFWYNKATLQKYAQAQYNLGLLYLYGKENISQDYKKAVYWFEKAAVQGVVRAQYNLGVSYYMGNGVPKNKKNGLFWLEKAANQNKGEISTKAKQALEKMISN